MRRKREYDCVRGPFNVQTHFFTHALGPDFWQCGWWKCDAYYTLEQRGWKRTSEVLD